MRCPYHLTPLLGALATAASAQTTKLLYTESPPVWFEAHNITAAVAPDGATALLPSRWPPGVRVIDLATGVPRQDPGVGLDEVRNAASRAVNARGDVASFQGARTNSGITVTVGARETRLDVPGVVTAITWVDSVDLLALASDARGSSSLYRINTTTGSRSIVARDLDAEPVRSRIAVDRDRRHVYIALAGDPVDPPAARHEAFADRDLDLYEIDLSTGDRRPIVDTDADETAPFVVGDDLYWTSTRFESSIVVVPIAGGSVRHVLQNAMHPVWHPNGRTLGVVYGAFRAADWALNWDGGSIELDPSVSAARITPLLTNYHEDFEPNWSPDGKWIAYHSHRAAGPVISYGAPGSTDAIWLKRADSREQIQVTKDKWEVGSPDWSGDGKRLVYTGWVRNQPGRTYASMITIDPTSGHVLSDAEIPLGQIPSAETAFWSPTSGDIAIEAVRAPGRRELWLVEPDGSDARKVVDYTLHTYGGLSWTRDGSALVYPSIVDHRMQLFKVSAAGGTPVQLTRDSGHLLHPRVSPDGQWVAATRLVNTKEIRRLRLGEPEVRAIDLRRAAYERAAGSGDLDGVVRSYTRDAVLFSPAQNEPIRGSAGIRTSFQSPDRYRLTHDVIELDVRGDRAYEIGKWMVRGLDGVAQRGGWYSWVWWRQPDGIWAIDRDVWSRACGAPTAPPCP
jgi:Tol biopolymer transport system component/ketosteroid isomerase-like protein